MTVFNGAVLYLMIWWTTLFAVLPFGVRPVDDGDPASGGWRGAPERPHLVAKVAVTTLLAAVIWCGCYWVIVSGWISFRHGWLALPES